MSQSIIMGAKGLVESMNELTTGQAGAMRRLINGVILRDNVVEPRCGFVPNSITYPSANQASVLIDLSPVSSSKTTDFVVVSTVSGSPGAPYLMQGDGTTITGPFAGGIPGGLYTDPGLFIDYNRYDYARGSVYLSSDIGPVKYIMGDTFSSVTLHEPSNPLPMPITSSYASYNWHANASMVAYRFCVVHEDGNGYKVRTAPSGSSWFYNETGAACAATVYCPLPIGTAAGDTVELYRTLSIAGEIDPGDEMFLVAEKIVEAADVTAGELVIEDYTEATAMGAALYTNSTQQSLLKANNVPPASVDIAYFQSCMFYANCKERPFLQKLLIHADDNSTAAASSDWLGVHTTTTTAAYASGVTAIAVTSVAGWEVGMALGATSAAFPSETGNPFPASARITSIVGTTVNFSPATTAGLTLGQTVFAKDVVTIRGVDFVASPTGSGVSGSSYGYFNTYTGAPPAFQLTPLPVTAYRQRNALQNLSYSIGLFNALNNSGVWANVVTDARGAYLVLSNSVEYYKSNIEFESTNAGAWSAYSGGTEEVSQSTFPNRIYYSKPDEPEAVPLLNYLSVGSEKSKILRIVPFTDSLMVFKEDGVWRISGDAPDGWRVDFVSKDHVLHSPRSATVMNNLCYFWGSKGFWSVNSYGEFSNIGQNISDTAMNSIFANIQTESTARYYFAQGFPRKNLVCFAYADGPFTFGYTSDLNNPTETRYWLVYNIDTNTWSAWDMREGYTCAMYHADKNQLMLGGLTGAFAPIVYYDAEANAGEIKSVTGFNDGTADVVINAVSSTAITIDPNVFYVPRVGDYIQQTYRVIAVSSDTEFEVNEPGLSIGTYEATRGIRLVMEYQPIMANGTPMSFAQWQDIVVTMDEIHTVEDMFYVVMGATPDWVNALDAVSTVDSTINMTSTGVPARAFTHRVRLPKTAAMSGKIYPYVEVVQRQTYYAIKGLAVTYTGISDRTQRKAWPAL